MGEKKKTTDVGRGCEEGRALGALGETGSGALDGGVLAGTARIVELLGQRFRYVATRISEQTAPFRRLLLFQQFQWFVIYSWLINCSQFILLLLQLLLLLLFLLILSILLLLLLLLIPLLILLILLILILILIALFIHYIFIHD